MYSSLKILQIYKCNISVRNVKSFQIRLGDSIPFWVFRNGLIRLILRRRYSLRNVRLSGYVFVHFWIYLLNLAGSPYITSHRSMMSQKANDDPIITVMACTPVRSPIDLSKAPTTRKRTVQASAEYGGASPKVVKQEEGTEGETDQKQEGSDKESKKEENGAALEMLECPVCLDYPRSRPIYTCDNGHIVCPTCRAGLTSKHCQECMKTCRHCSKGPSALCKGPCKDCLGICPTCRDHKLKPDIFVGRLADKLLKEVMANCRFAAHGCVKQEKLGIIANHEERCQYREVHCPAKHRGACQWIGSLAKMIVHVKDAACIQILRSDNVNEPFKSFIGDFSQADMTVFNRTQVTHWKPVLLVSRTVVQYLLYLTIQRSATGYWYIHVRSFSPESLLQRITVRLELFKSGEESSSQKYIYEGGANSNKLSNDEALAAGKFLVLTDAQLKLLKTEQTIFEYKVSVSIDPHRRTSSSSSSSAVEAPVAKTVSDDK